MTESCRAKQAAVHATLLQSARNRMTMFAKVVMARETPGSSGEFARLTVSEADHLPDGVERMKIDGHVVDQ